MNARLQFPTAEGNVFYNLYTFVYYTLVELKQTISFWVHNKQQTISSFPSVSKLHCLQLPSTKGYVFYNPRRIKTDCPILST